ncbi:MAG: ferredoxin--NADP reductase, partial [Stenotrophomonas nitritireducens]|nr:ferredoxin--NADP reductase [Stenotrophomonas nitritireducens]
QHLKVGDTILVGRKPTGTLLISDLHPGRHLYLLGTGTGLAPWLSIVKDPETYERFDKVIVCHGVRFERDLAYRDYFEKELFEDEILGDIVRDKLLYYPAVTREPFRNQGRLTTLIESGEMPRTLGLPAFDPANDRFMICGSPQMLADLRSVLDARGFEVSPRIGSPGHYVFERAFVEK